MNHYPSDQWIDFINGKLPQAEREAMQLHLDRGCYDCQDIAQTWQRVQEAARRELLYQIPEGVVGYVKDAFLLQRQIKARKKIIIPSLTFDSHWDALPVGVRSSGVSQRLLQFQTDAFLIHVSLEVSKGHRMVSVDGQLADATGQNRELDKIPVDLLQDEEVLSQTQTNRFGEFHLEYQVFPDRKATIAIGEGERTVIPLGAIWGRPNGEASA
jgi:hypothetical protein